MKYICHHFTILWCCYSEKIATKIWEQYCHNPCRCSCGSCAPFCMRVCVRMLSMDYWMKDVFCTITTTVQKHEASVQGKTFSMNRQHSERLNKKSEVEAWQCAVSNMLFKHSPCQPWQAWHQHDNYTAWCFNATTVTSVTINSVK